MNPGKFERFHCFRQLTCDFPFAVHNCICDYLLSVFPGWTIPISKSWPMAALKADLYLYEEYYFLHRKVSPLGQQVDFMKNNNPGRESSRELSRPSGSTVRFKNLPGLRSKPVDGFMGPAAKNISKVFFVTHPGRLPPLPATARECRGHGR